MDSLKHYAFADPIRWQRHEQIENDRQKDRDRRTETEGQRQLSSHAVNGDWLGLGLGQTEKDRQTEGQNDRDS